MRRGIRIEVSPLENDRLEAMVLARGLPQQYACQARIILLVAPGLRTAVIMVTTDMTAASLRRQLTQ
jgi:hypothetical protein